MKHTPTPRMDAIASRSKGRDIQQEDYYAALDEGRKLEVEHADLLAALQMFEAIDNQPEMRGAMPVFLRDFRDAARAAIARSEGK